MPTSEASPATAAATPVAVVAERISPFLKGVLLAVILGMGSVGFLNWWQSPFAAFRPFLPPVTQRTPGAVLEADRQMQMRWLIHEGQNTSAHTLLIGPSQMLIGMDTCGYPDLKRLALFALTDYEIMKLLQATVPNLKEPTTFLIGEGLSTPIGPEPVQGRMRRLWRDLFSEETTRVSLLNLYMSLAPGRPPCAAVEYTRNIPGAKSPRVIHKTLAFLGQNLAPPSALAELLRTVEPSCSRFHHTIVIAKLPVMFTVADEPQLMAMEASQRQTAHDALAAFDRRKTGCKVLFRDLATPYTVANAAHGPKPSEWYDALHFRPELGAQLLKSLVDSSQNDAPEMEPGQ